MWTQSWDTDLNGRAKAGGQKEGIPSRAGHGHHTPHSLSLSGLTYPALEDFLSSEEPKGRRKEETCARAHTHTHTHTPTKALTVFSDQTPSWLCSLPADLSPSRPEGVGGHKGELRTYLATQIKQTTNWHIIFCFFLNR